MPPLRPLKYGQSNLDISDDIDLERDRARYEADWTKDLYLSGAHGLPLYSEQNSTSIQAVLTSNTYIAHLERGSP